MGTNYQKRPQTFATNVTVGKTLTVSSNTTLTKAVTASSAVSVAKTLTLSSNAKWARQTATTAGTALVNYGISSVARKSSAGASTQLYTLNAPVVGISKWLLATNAGSTRTARVTCAANVSFYNSTAVTTRKVTFKAPGQMVQLIGLSTISWGIVATRDPSTLGIAFATT